jgi:hypothetical protein
VGETPPALAGSPYCQRIALVGSVVFMNIRRWIAIGLAAVAAASATTATATAATAATTQARHAYLQQDLQRDLDAITARQRQ